MPSNQQRRQAAKRKLQRQLERREQRARAHRQRLIIVGVIAAVLVVVGGVWLVASSLSGPDETASSGNPGGDGGDMYATDTAAADATGGSSDPAGSEASGTAPASGDGTVTCAYPADGTAAKDVTPPTDLHPSNSGTVDATLALNTGDVQLQLDRVATPCTVNSFVALAKQHYFDDTTCHRLTSSPSLKVLQCGDPTGTGSGGPGYTFADELTGGETYTAGTLAMANRGADTNGSQFFIVYADSGLPANYTVFGKVTSGLDVVTDIAAKGAVKNGQATDDGAPAEPVTITGVTVS